MLINLYCSVYSCCYATIARRNMHFLVTAGKHVNNNRAFARQLVGKCVPTATGTHATVELLLPITMKMVISMCFLPKCYK
jgi:hypothetical protein